MKVTEIVNAISL